MLASGARLGPYEVVSAAGAGGMGEVYKARDTRLDRVTRDGQRFLLNVPLEQAAAAPITVVLNLTAGLKK